MSKHENYRHHNRHQHPAEETLLKDRPLEKQVDKEAEEPNPMEALADMIDADAARIGLVIADIFKTMSIASAMLPDMELHTELMNLSVNEDGISVSIFHTEDEDEEDDEDEDEDGDEDDFDFDFDYEEENTYEYND